MTRDPNSYIQHSVDHLAETLLNKNADYAPTGEFSNFEKAADIAGISVSQLILAQIAIKMTRIEKLMGQMTLKNEPLEDSFLDLAGYATIGHAWLVSHSSAEKAEGVIENRTMASSDWIRQVITDRAIIRNSVDDECFHSWVQVGNDISECDACGHQRHG